jgi:hypothetical protein
MLNKKIRIVFKLSFCFLLATCVQLGEATAQNTVQQVEQPVLERLVADLNQEFSPGTISAVALADLALAKVEQAQTVLQNFVRDKEIQCQDNFFVTACFDALRLKRRQLQEILRRISVEAKSFLRQARAAKLEPSAQSQADFESKRERL